MLLRRLLAIAAGFALVSVVAGRASAQQNDAPFTIRYPPDGATVRENVHIRIPLASIPEKGYVVIQVNRRFIAAVAPSDDERASARPGAMFEYVWDTKAPMKVGNTTATALPRDGEYQIDANLYAPGENNSVVLKQNSSVKVTLANKINEPDKVTLRYRFRDGVTRTYNRTGDAKIETRDQNQPNGKASNEYVAQRGELLLSVEDLYPNGNAMVRNKLTKLIVRQGDRETSYPAEQLTKSLYQELDPYGNVKYQNKTASFEEFAKLGLPVSTTVDLPPLPESPVGQGDTWTTDKVSLDIPGTPPDKQPKERVTNTLEAFEWQDGYPTAKIHQHYEGKAKGTVTFGTTDVESPTIRFDRDIWVAYRAGMLVKMTRTVEVRGKMVAPVGMVAGPPGMGSGSGPYGGSGSYPPGYSGGSSPYPPGYGSGTTSPYPPGYNGGSGSGPYGGSSYPGSGATRRNRMPYGSGGSSSYPYGGGSSSYPYGSGGSSSYPYGGSSSYPYGGSSYPGAAPQPTESLQIGLTSTTTTEIAAGAGQTASR